MIRFTFVSVCGAALLASGVSAAGQEPLRFNRDIRPILSDTCFKCHGPDSVARKAGMRLDMRESAIEHEAIVPGDVSKSKIVTRIFSRDPDEQMPPPESKLSLTTVQQETLK